MVKPSEILRKAALWIERDIEWSGLGCCAISCAAQYDDHKEESAMHYFRQVGPRIDTHEDPWWGNWETYRAPTNQCARIIGLCLAAAIAESEGN